MRDHDVSELTANELERARRELAASLALTRPDSPARVPIMARLSAIDAELAGRTAAPVPATCLECGMPDPPPEPTCTLGRDHRVGSAHGCPECLRTRAACTARPCSAMRGKAIRARTSLP